jgi:hypothetical protein
MCEFCAAKNDFEVKGESQPFLYKDTCASPSHESYAAHVGFFPLATE